MWNHTSDSKPLLFFFFSHSQLKGLWDFFRDVDRGCSRALDQMSSHMTHLAVSQKEKETFSRPVPVERASSETDTQLISLQTLELEVFTHRRLSCIHTHVHAYTQTSAPSALLSEPAPQQTADRPQSQLIE